MVPESQCIGKLFERALQVRFADEIDANTLSGLFMFRLGRIPEAGDAIVEEQFCFTVESMAGRRVNLVKIEPGEPDTPAKSDPGPASVSQ